MDLKSEGTYERETTFWRVATDTKIVEKLTALARNIAIQGECIGEGIQKNPYNIKGQTLRIFDIYDIDANQYLTREERSQLLADLDLIGLQVPVIDGKYALSADTDGLLKMAEGKSQMADVEREGIVFKALERKDKMIFSFKAISNNYLLNEKE
jgi:RNA ligase (TIGR02306 family)